MGWRKRDRVAGGGGDSVDTAAVNTEVNPEKCSLEISHTKKLKFLLLVILHNQPPLICLHLFA